MRTTSGSDRRAPGGAGAREPEGSTLSVRVVPGAARDSLENDPTRGWIVRVAAQPVDGRANERVCAFVARRQGRGGWRRRGDRHRVEQRRQFLEYVGGRFDQLGSVADQAVATARQRVVDRAGDREHLAPLFGSTPRGDERAAAGTRFHDQRADSEPADDAVASREVLA